MRKEYDFNRLTPAEPKYLRRLRKSVTIRVDETVIGYFKTLSSKTGLTYQGLMNFVLRDYASKGLSPSANWKPVKKKAA